MAKRENENTVPDLPVGEDPLKMAEQNKKAFPPHHEHTSAPDKKPQKRKRIPK